MRHSLPRTRGCYVCGKDNPAGLRLQMEAVDGRVVGMWDASAVYAGYGNLLHGGLMMTLLDEVMTWAAILHARQPCVAGEITTRFLLPAPVEQTYQVVGWVERARSRLLITKGELRDPQGHVIAAAEGRYVPVSAERARLRPDDFVDPWTLDWALELPGGVPERTRGL